MSNGTTTEPSKDAVDRGVDAAFAAEGYVLDEGGRDYAKMRAAAYQAFKPAKVLGLHDRDAKAITRNTLIIRTFPNLPVPADTGARAAASTTDPDALAVIAIWKAVDRLVWDVTKPGPSGVLQTMVANDMGNGYVVCRHKSGVDRVDAAYVTDDLRCIEADYIGPDDAALQRLISRAVRNRSMLIMIRPEADQTRILRGYDRVSKLAVAAGHDRLAEAIEASRPPAADDDGDGLAA